MELAPLLKPQELEVLICGRLEVDVDLLQQCIEYSEGANEDMPHVQHFWEVLREMTSEERTSFLRFVWARSRMPNSAKDFPMNFKLQAAHDPGALGEPDQYLPHAQACFFALCTRLAEMLPLLEIPYYRGIRVRESWQQKGLKGERQEEPEPPSEQKAEDTGLEMQNDFESTMHDMPDDEEGEQNESEDREELDREMGDFHQNDENVVDEKLCGEDSDHDEDRTDEEKLKFEENSRGERRGTKG
ncbi:hypothetical protein PsorP6_007060 [Peronosclerospora sorghi]|uniref:Uncharacterized protein n=1 Tax=Peronosclerospora sorghi TaxID=230839 RepID=A0ACC0WA49_9STRA|nr:hypothetical protein PsorP6_007060 [Peronosclerospora sorghi]